MNKKRLATSHFLFRNPGFGRQPFPGFRIYGGIHAIYGVHAFRKKCLTNKLLYRNIPTVTKQEKDDNTGNQGIRGSRSYYSQDTH
jgi:hypothetical protein